MIYVLCVHACVRASGGEASWGYRVLLSSRTFLVSLLARGLARLFSR